MKLDPPGCDSTCGLLCTKVVEKGRSLSHQISENPKLPSLVEGAIGWWLQNCSNLAFRYSTGMNLYKLLQVDKCHFGRWNQQSARTLSLDSTVYFRWILLFYSFLRKVFGGSSDCLSLVFTGTFLLYDKSHPPQKRTSQMVPQLFLYHN